MDTLIKPEYVYLSFAVEPKAYTVTFLGCFQSIIPKVFMASEKGTVLLLTIGVPADLRVGDNLLTTFKELAEYTYSNVEPVYLKKKVCHPTESEIDDLQHKAHVAISQLCS